MSEVTAVFDASVSDPPQLELDPDLFKAWTQGCKVSELVSLLQRSLLSQYDLSSSICGSGYASSVHAHRSAAASATLTEDLTRTQPETDTDTGTHADAVTDINVNAATGETKANDESQAQSVAAADRIQQHDNDSKNDGVDDTDRALQQRLKRSKSGNDGAPDDYGHEAERSHNRRGSGVRGVAGVAAVGSILPAASLPLPPLPSSLDLHCSSAALNRLLWVWESQMVHQYRLFSMIEHSLKKPFLLSAHYCLLQLSFQMQLQLTNMYYDLDPVWTRQLIGAKLSTLKTRSNLAALHERMQTECVARMATQEHEQEQRRAREQRWPQSWREMTRIQREGGAEDGSGAINYSISAVGMQSLPAPSDFVRFSSCCRQFDNLRRLYHARWGEKGDGVIVEIDMRMDDDGAAAAARKHQSAFHSSHSPHMTGAGRKWDERLMLSERWRMMRAAATAAMARRGFGVDKHTAGSASPMIGAASSAGARTQPWLRSLDAAEAQLMSSSGIGSLDEFFGFDSSSQPMRASEHTAPVFFQRQFRLHSSLPRCYSRLIFLSHYRIAMDIRRKKAHDALTFDEAQLIAQILMRCWAMPVGTVEEWFEKEEESRRSRTGSSQQQQQVAQQTSADPALSSSFQPSVDIYDDAQSSERATQSASDLASSAASQQAAAEEQKQPVPALARRLSATDPTHPNLSSHSDSSVPGAAADGFDFLPIVAQMRDVDEEIFVGDVIDAEFINGLKHIKTHVTSRMMEDYAIAMTRMCKEAATIAERPLSQQTTQDAHRTVVLHRTATWADCTDMASQEAGLEIAVKASNDAETAAASLFAFPPPSGSTSLPPSSSGSPASAPSSTASVSSLRPSVLLKLPSKLLPLIKSFHSLAASLHKTKQLRSLLHDIHDGPLKTMEKMGAGIAEVAFVMTALRHTFTQLPHVKQHAITSHPQYPYAYQRMTRSDGSTACSSLPPSDSSHRSFINWCRFLDAVTPITIILWMKASHSHTAE